MATPFPLMGLYEIIKIIQLYFYHVKEEITLGWKGGYLLFMLIFYGAAKFNMCKCWRLPMYYVINKGYLEVIYVFFECFSF